jgi:hypothetical protein
MLPVTCAVKIPRFKNPITSTMPAIALSKVGNHPSDREDIVTSDAPLGAFKAVGSVVDIAAVVLRLCRILANVVDD